MGKETLNNMEVARKITELRVSDQVEMYAGSAGEWQKRQGLPLLMSWLEVTLASCRDYATTSVWCDWRPGIAVSILSP